MKNAIIAVKAAKKQGKGAFQFSNADMSMQAKKQLGSLGIQHVIDGGAYTEVSRIVNEVRDAKAK